MFDWQQWLNDGQLISIISTYFHTSSFSRIPLSCSFFVCFFNALTNKREKKENKNTALYVINVLEIAFSGFYSFRDLGNTLFRLSLIRNVSHNSLRRTLLLASICPREHDGKRILYDKSALALLLFHYYLRFFFSLNRLGMATVCAWIFNTRSKHKEFRNEMEIKAVYGAHKISIAIDFTS